MAILPNCPFQSNTGGTAAIFQICGFAILKICEFVQVGEPAQMPKTVETAFNIELSRLLRKRHPRWREEHAETDAVAAEQTRILEGKPGAKRLRPDIVIRHPGGLPVVVETEFHPANAVEKEAISRLGYEIGGHPVEGAIAVRVPLLLAGLQTSLEKHIEEASFEYCLYSGTRLFPERWPEQGWLVGNLDALAEAVEHVALSETRLAAAADILESGIRSGAELLRSGKASHPEMLNAMAAKLHQEDGEQTTRMAVAIIANAFVFQAAIAGNHGIRSPDELREAGEYSKLRILESWEDILKVNYWPIFRLAADLLESVPLDLAPSFLKRMIELTANLADKGAARMHDLSGQMFQRLIADRKFLATFYTLPSSAALLAGLAVSRLRVDWADGEALTQLRIADFACGTGSLIAAAYHAAAARHRRNGGDDRELHPKMMEDVLIATDIMPAATHLTASALSSAHPGTVFGSTQIYTMPYGEDDGEVQIGALNLLGSEQAISLFDTGAVLQAGGREEARTQDIEVPWESCHLTIMNPPFTRPTNHESTDAPVPSFAGFRTEKEEQEKMSARLKRVTREIKDPYTKKTAAAGHGNAGLASNFIDLAHAMLRPGGILALVLPASFTRGAAWENARRLLTRNYRNVAIVGISTDGSNDRAFSADTGMAEVLVLATKAKRDSKITDCENSLFVANLRRRPRTQLEGSLIAAAIETARIDVSVSGKIELGNDLEAGNFLRAPLESAVSAFGVRGKLPGGRNARPRQLRSEASPIHARRAASSYATFGVGIPRSTGPRH